MASQHLVIRDTPNKISEGLWKSAYQQLEDDDKAMLEKHGSQLSYQNSIFIDQKRAENEKHQWTLTVVKKKFKVRDIALKVIGLIDASGEYIKSVAELEPHVAMAWLGASAILPVCVEFLIPITYPSQLEDSLTWSYLVPNLGTVDLEDRRARRSYAKRFGPCHLLTWTL